MPPLLAEIDYFTLPTIKKTDWDVLGDDLLLDFELEGFKIMNATMDPQPNVIIDDNAGIKLSFQNLQFRLIGNYSFMTDPPIFADIGEADFFFSSTNFSIQIKTEIIRTSIGHKLQLQISDVKLEADDEPFMNLNGINDFS